MHNYKVKLHYDIIEEINVEAVNEWRAEYEALRKSDIPFIPSLTFVTQIEKISKKGESNYGKR